ncbi:hypothetical protein MH215_10175 [Paenibacillus sp. ACRSA]|uniref:hypothetical protein n=1 Tax=Paenibacillus sp. ACRSA TaxID=2918211 RepID=UPI001EF71993|nr:hypothetical protein [Paenibacillus sp. ACRSA]MCG7377362.1 hypothetical protein [Paenibacillus sp. ACRSA]
MEFEKDENATKYHNPDLNSYASVHDSVLNFILHNSRFEKNLIYENYIRRRLKMNSSKTNLEKLENLEMYLKELEGEDFLYEVVSVYDMLLTHTYTKDIINHAVQEFEEIKKKHEAYKMKKIVILQEFKNKAIEHLYDLYKMKCDQSEHFLFMAATKEDFINTEIYQDFGGDTADGYEGSFKRLDNLLQNKRLFRDKNPEVDNIIAATEFLREKFNWYKDEKYQGWFETTGNSFLKEISTFKTNYMLNYKRYNVLMRNSIGAAILFIESFILRINPNKKMIRFLKEYSYEPFLLTTKEANVMEQSMFVYNFYQKEEQFQKIYLKIRTNIFRIIHKIKIKIHENLSISQVIENFKTRCMWYDKERIRGRIHQDGQRKRNCEDILMREMALYLFDNGHPVISRIQTENLQTDLMDLSSQISVLIECKVYHQNSKSNLIQGFAQLHAYLNNFENSHFRITTAYYVIFRINGPIFDLPLRITTNRYSIIPIIIDLGESRVSGSKQSNNPIKIEEKEFIESLENTFI